MKYAAYNQYKTSNIGWIRDFPAHWELKRLKYVANRAEVKVEADEDNPLPYIGLEQVEPWTGRLIDLDNDLVPTGVSNRFAAGDTLFGKLRPYLAKACNVDFDGLCSSELLVLRGKTYDRKFLLYQLLSHGFINFVDSSTYGSKMPRASWDFIGICEIPLPPLDEQQTIARFLDAKTAQIDALVAHKRQLIAKLKEKRSALIARTVTRGLPPEAAKAAGLEPNPQMKDSGVDWLGEIPLHWKAMRAKYLCLAVVDCKNRTPEYFDDGDYLVVRTTDVRDGQLTFEGMLRTDEENFHIWTERGAPRAGDVVFTREAPAGEAAIFDGSVPMCLGQRMMYFRVDPKQLSSRYLLHWLHGSAAKGYINSMSGGSTVTHLRVGQVHDFPVATPPISEQLAIADYLEDQSFILDELTARAEAAITRLTEYRQALITSAVTGKIDVRAFRQARAGAHPVTELADA